MTAVRALLHNRPMLAMLLVLTALLARALVPAGYMPSGDSRSISVMLCADAGAVSIRMDIPMDERSTPGSETGSHGNEPCAFGTLAFLSLSGADSLLLAVAYEYIIVLGFAPAVQPILQGISHLRPPLRGPPAFS